MAYRNSIPPTPRPRYSLITYRGDEYLQKTSQSHEDNAVHQTSKTEMDLAVRFVPKFLLPDLIKPRKSLAKTEIHSLPYHPHLFIRPALSRLPVEIISRPLDEHAGKICSVTTIRHVPAGCAQPRCRCSRSWRLSFGTPVARASASGASLEGRDGRCPAEARMVSRCPPTRSQGRSCIVLWPCVLVSSWRCYSSGFRTG